MPLVDGPELEIDQELTSLYSQSFTSNKGILVDNAGLAWMRWRADGLEAWWNFFEENIDAPMGRRLANAACDEEEWLISGGQIDVSGFFKKRKASDAIISRWKLYGWGMPSISPPGVEGGFLTPIVCGILQANLERQNNERYKMRWEQKTADMCRLNLEISTMPLVPSGPSKNSSNYQIGESVELQIESGWRLDGQRHCLLPSGLFSRLEDSCAGLVADISDDIRDAWPQINDGFLSMALASFKLFIAGEELFMALDAESWLETANVVFGEKGLGSPFVAKSIDENGGVELHYESLPFLPISLGMLAGAWTRCEGRPVKVELIDDEGKIVIRLSSRYELA